MIPFQFNKAQEYIDNIVEDLLANGKPVRLIFLKARQMGISTYCEGRLFHLAHQTPYSNCLVIAQNSDSTENIFSMSKLFYEELPKWNKPATQYSNRKELVFDRLGEKVLRSRMTIDSAENKNAGRSWTLHGVHLSEFAFWPDTKTILTGVLQAVPKLSNTFVFIESTANGIGGEFYEMFWRAWRGESDWKAIFIPWFWMPEYSMELEEPRKEFEKSLTKYEKALIENYGVTLEQINWRRHTIATEFNGDEQYFQQEFPATPEEAFISTGRSVFNTQLLQSLIPQCPKPIMVCNLERLKDKVIPAPASDGYLQIWKMPEKYHLYVIGADVAEGLENGDYSSADVLDALTLEQVAHWHGHIDPDLFGEELVKLAQFYNNAFIACEANNHGLTTITSIVNKRYYKLYRRKEYDKVTHKLKEELGWLTTTKTKPLAIDLLNQLIREGEIKINCRETLQECLTFVKDAKGKMHGQGGEHDDRVMSLAIACKVWEEIPKEVAIPQEKKAKTKEELIWEYVLGEKPGERQNEYLGIL